MGTRLMRLILTGGSFLLCVGILTACSTTQLPTPHPQATRGFVGPAINTINNLSVRIDHVAFGEDVGDLVGDGELQFELIAVRPETGHSRRMVTPGNGVLDLNPGAQFTLNEFALTINDVGADEEIMLFFMAIDIDERDVINGIATDAAIDGIQEALEHGLKRGALGTSKVVSKTTIVTFLLAQLTDVFVSWWEQADPLGAYGVILSPENNWLRNQQYADVPTDSNMNVMFSVLDGNDSVAVVTVETIVTAEPLPTKRSTHTPQPPPTEPPAPNRPDPISALNDYFTQLSLEDYDAAWSRLSDSFVERNHTNSDGTIEQDGYIAYWQQVDTAWLYDIKLLAKDAYVAEISATLSIERFDNIDSKIPFRFILVYNEERGLWQIDRARRDDAGD